MTEQEFLKIKNRYYNWKALLDKHSRTPLQVEQAALRWGYNAALKDARAAATEALFGGLELD